MRAKAADLVIVPHGEIRQHLLNECVLAEERVVLLPDLVESANRQAFDPGGVKKRYHLNPAHAMVFFSGEISHAAGADPTSATRGENRVFSRVRAS